MNATTYQNYLSSRMQLEAWIASNGGFNAHPCRTVGETASVAQSAGISGLSVEEIIWAQDYETEKLGF